RRPPASPTRRSSDLGTLLAGNGAVIGATLVANAASQGLAEFLVKARPRIAVVAGGDEVVSGSTPVAAKIFDANTPLVLGLAQNQDRKSTRLNSSHVS